MFVISRIKRMMGKQSTLELLEMPMEVHIPDFPIIYDLCKEYELDKNETTTIESLEWKQFNVKKVTVKFKDIDVGPFEEKRQELMAEINEQGDVEWDIYIESRNTGDVHIKRMGALCQAVGFNDVPMVLNGPWLSDKIHVRGRVEMSPEMQQQGMLVIPDLGEPQMTTLIHEEEWKLDKHPNHEDVYVGTYALKQQPLLQQDVELTSENAPVNMIFDCQVFFCLSDTIENNINHAGDSNVDGHVV
eukprot:384174_1